MDEEEGAARVEKMLNTMTIEQLQASRARADQGLLKVRNGEVKVSADSLRQAQVARERIVGAIVQRPNKKKKPGGKISSSAYLNRRFSTRLTPLESACYRTASIGFAQLLGRA